MQPAPDPLGMSSSLAARRPAATNLPNNFELPPPPLAQLHTKFQNPLGLAPVLQNGSHDGSGPPPASVTSAGNLLTPPNSVPTDAAVSPSPAVFGATSSTSAQAFPPLNATHYWPAVQSSYPPYQSASPSHWQGRPLFSPSSLNSVVRGGSSSGHPGETMSPSTAYELNHLPPFQHTLPLPSTNGLSANQQALLNPAMLSAHGAQHATLSHTSPLIMQDPFGMRPLPTPTTYYNSPQSTTSPSHPGYHFGLGPSPTGASPPVSGGGPGTMISPRTMGEENGSLSAHSSLSPQSHQRSSSHYSLPALGGPGIPTLQSPTGPLPFGTLSSSMMQGMANPHVMPHMYGGNTHGHGHRDQPPQAQSERPFKCDQCPQSFNRNHDLKRHKRIHLAVKPYPCAHCEKSFSRKDALKRHILVKGCGKAQPESNSSDGNEKGSESPPVHAKFDPITSSMPDVGVVQPSLVTKVEA